MIKRIAALITKEILTLVRDPRSRILLIGPPIIQLIIFSFAATLEVKNVSLAVFNQDSGKHGHEIVGRLSGSPTFTDFRFLYRQEDITFHLDNQTVLAAVHIPADFSRRIGRGETATVQLVLDGRRSNAAQIVSGYITQLVRAYGRELGPQGGATIEPVVAERNWFNENLLYIWFTVPCLVGIISMIMALVVTALSVARERELGTFDQLLVSPLTPFEILAGKTVPAIIIGLSEGLSIFLVGVLLFGVPFKGSFALLFFTLLLFILSIVGLGLFISAIAKTQQQGILGAFIILVPAVCLSGYASPVENMPEWLQSATWFNPLKHAIITFKGLFLKDLPFADVWENTWPLLIIGSVSLLLSGWFFSRKLE
ncbi:ABC transporter permease [Desulfovibrio sp. OttesenSCG-928-M14]|nr:ABC transporter permease [Desulfovibrio sp. OttesenSCG-928-M16]MDL2216199.1 ABC transporter permease [Desulfovibrio sp. OttesenSCG-928-M14]